MPSLSQSLINESRLASAGSQTFLGSTESHKLSLLNRKRATPCPVLRKRSLQNVQRVRQGRVAPLSRFPSVPDDSRSLVAGNVIPGTTLGGGSIGNEIGRASCRERA